MKRANLLKLFVASTLLFSVASGCKKNPKNITPIANNSRPIGANNDLGNPFPGGDRTGQLNLPGTQGTPIDAGNIADPMLNADEDRATLSQQTIYFDFDRSAVKPSEQPKLEPVATFLKSTPGVQLKVEGHCDERGTEEYNRALGERRAIAIRELLIQKHGIESDRVTTVSFGEDRPVSLEKTGEGYARNRRGEFVILRPR